MPLPSLEYGLAGVVPADATGAWGCRAIVTQDGQVDLAADRIDRKGDPVILERLKEQFPLPTLIDTLAGLLRSGRMNTRVAEQFTLYRSDDLHVVADTAASSGYCYVAAWTASRGV
jgi:hypothetical protein